MEPVGERDREGRPFEDAHAIAVQALESTRSRLVTLRKQREAINAEIKTLVDDEDLLTRMTRVRKVKG
jgi:cell division protein FtsB